MRSPPRAGALHAPPTVVSAALAALWAVAALAAPASRPASGPGSRPSPPAEVLPAVDPSLPAFVPAAPDSLSGTLNCAGDAVISNLLGRWADAFNAVYPKVDVRTNGAGSETAAPALVDGSAQLGAMTRPMDDAERAAFAKKFGYAPTELVVGMDAVAIFVEKSNPIAARGLTLRELDSVFSRQVRRGGTPARVWGDLGLAGEWAARPITLYGLVRHRTTTVLVRELVLGGSEMTAAVQPLPTHSSVVQGVGADPAGIGYASVFYQTRRTRMVPLNGPDGRLYAPTAENCQAGRYPLVRAFYLYVNKPPGRPLPPAQDEFLRYIFSRPGQEVAADGGNIPLAADAVRAQLDKLETRP